MIPPASPSGVRIVSPEGAIAPTGTWSLGARAGDFIFVAGMRGIDPVSNTMLPDDGDEGEYPKRHRHEFGIIAV